MKLNLRSCRTSIPRKRRGNHKQTVRLLRARGLAELGKVASVSQQRPLARRQKSRFSGNRRKPKPTPWDKPTFLHQINSHLNEVVPPPAPFGLGRNGCWPFRGSQLPRELPLELTSYFLFVVVVWEGIQTQSGSPQIKARVESLCFYHPGLLRCPH